MTKHAHQGPRTPVRRDALASRPYDLNGRDLEDRPSRLPDHWNNDGLVVSTAVDPDEWPAWTDADRWALAAKGGADA